LTDGIIRTHNLNSVPASLLTTGNVTEALWRYFDMPILSSKKQCNKCGEWKQKTDFYRDNTSRDGYQGRCKACSVAGRKAWAKSNPNKIKEYRQGDYAKHSDNYKARAKEYRTSNYEWKRETDKQWRENNKERKSLADKIYRILHRDKELHNAKNREYVRSHPEKARVWCRRRRANKHAAGGGGISIADEKYIKTYTNGTCSYCGKKAKLELDHVVAITKGGADHIDNAAPACSTCNKKKKNRPLIVFLRDLLG
jgi:5-methylcytosine-specific restriction endonuclease McrA